jgi:hypothetical protein
MSGCFCGGALLSCARAVWSCGLLTRLQEYEVIYTVVMMKNLVLRYVVTWRNEVKL